MKLIPLTQGQFAIVDDADFEWLSQWKWHLSHGYATRKEGPAGGQRRIMMHYQIMPAPAGKDTDHHDRNKLNNQRSNLRICTEQQNTFNRGPNTGSSSQYKGVSRAKNGWVVTIGIDRKSYRIGLFDNEIDAARAYDAKAKELHGNFAYLNFPDEISIPFCSNCKSHHSPYDLSEVLSPECDPALITLAVCCAQVKHLKQHSFHEAAKVIAAQMLLYRP